jgi:uncharacterized membrane protein YhaH (DUF805 family)
MIMRGNVIGFDSDTNTGAISGHDGQRYDFVTQTWHGHSRPHHGDVVDFQVAPGQRAIDIYLLDAEYVQPTFGQFYFSPHGRISRSQYWLRFVLPYVVIYVVLVALASSLGGAGSDVAAVIFSVLLVIFVLVALWPSLAILIKRAHDRDWPWPFVLLFLVPIVSLWPMIELGFLRGTIGGNRFGADPVPRT